MSLWYFLPLIIFILSVIFIITSRNLSPESKFVIYICVFIMYLTQIQFIYILYSLGR